MDLFYMLAWFCNIIHWSLGKYFFTELGRFSKCLNHLIIQYQKATFANTTADLIRKFFRYREPVNSQGQIHVSQNSNFCLKARILESTTNIIRIFFKWQNHFDHFREKCLTNTQVSLTIVCQPIVISSKKWCSMRNTASSSSQLKHTGAFLLRKPCFFTILKRWIFKDWEWKIFTAPTKTFLG